MNFKNFFQKLSVPHFDSISQRQNNLINLWNSICSCTLNNSRDSLIEIRKLISLFIREMCDMINCGLTNQVKETLEMHQIPKKIVLFGIANVPNNLIHEVFLFFISFTKLPLVNLLSEPYVIEPLNSLLENPHPEFQKAQSDNDENTLYNLVIALMNYITTSSLVSKRVRYFLKKNEKFESSPLIHQFSQYIVTNYAELNDIILKLIVGTNDSPDLLNFILTYTPLLSTLIDICKDFVENKICTDEAIEFIHYVNIAVDNAAEDFAIAFSALFDEVIIKPLVVNSNVEQSLLSSLYILSCFSSNSLVGFIYEFIFNSFDSFINSNSEPIQFLTIRVVNLLLEVIYSNHLENSNFSTELNLIFNDKWDIPKSVKVSLDFMNLIDAEWFVKPDINLELYQSKMLVSFLKPFPKVEQSQNKSHTDSISLDFKKTPILESFIKLFSNFLNNSLRVNFALMEFFSFLSAVPSNYATYFTLSDDCSDGLFKTLETLAILLQRRIGKKPNTIQNLEDAYIKANFLSPEDLTNLPTYNSGLDGNDILFANNDIIFIYAVIFIEFLKQLHAIAQSKNLMNQRDSFASNNDSF